MQYANVNVNELTKSALKQFRKNDPLQAELDKVMRENIELLEEIRGLKRKNNAMRATKRKNQEIITRITQKIIKCNAKKY